MAEFGAELEESDRPLEVLDGEEGLLQKATEAYQEALEEKSTEELELRKLGSKNGELDIYGLTSNEMDYDLMISFKPTGNQSFLVENITDKYQTRYLNFFKYIIEVL